MFRLTNKGNQSRKNHKILNQTTKICDNAGGLSKTTIQAQLQQEEQEQLENSKVLRIKKSESFGSLSDSGFSEMSEIESVGNITVQNIPANPMIDIELYIQKMNDYVQHMKMLEMRNDALEAENTQFKDFMVYHQPVAQGTRKQL